jgi:hypothetical protein
MRKLLKLALVALLAMPLLAHGADPDGRRRFDRDAGKYVQVSVTDPYLELHIGPGRRYPVFHVVARGETIQILFRRTDWFKVRDEHDREGWARRIDMQETLLATGEKLPLEHLDHRDPDAYPWEAGGQTGNFGGGNVNSVYLSYSLNGNLSAELAGEHTIGHSSDSEMFLAGLTHTPRPDWRVAPFLDLGTGLVRVFPKASIVAPAHKREVLGYYGIGVKWYLTQRFLFRADYRSYVIFTKRDQNEDRNEWKAGFAFFF